MIPTYDDTAPSVNNPPYPGSMKVANEKEQAMNAAQAIQSKLQEMEAAQKEEERRKKEQKMAERIAMLEAAQTVKDDDDNSSNNVSKAATGRILEEVEKQETEMKDVEKRKRKRDKDSPMLITLKPFYRPNDKKSVKKRKLDSSELVDDTTEEEEFTPRSPVPLPEHSSLRPVLKPYMSKSAEKKMVKYADGVLPGQGSPDQSYSYASIMSSSASPVSVQEPVKSGKKKKYKKVTITVITQHSGDTDSDDEIPPPPPGSPPRYTTIIFFQKIFLTSLF